jgi:formylmethanofuran dehydrogenase subunit A
VNPIGRYFGLVSAQVESEYDLAEVTIMTAILCVTTGGDLGNGSDSDTPIYD